MSKREEIEDACEEMELPIGAGIEPPATQIISVKNHIYLYNDIDTQITRTLFSVLHETAMGIINNAVENNVPIVPIVLHINSCGGNCSDALAIVQCIKDIQNGTIHQIGGIPIKVPVNTIIEGEADSAASLIACVGNERAISKYALSLIHDVRQVGYGSAVNKVDDIEISAKNLQMFKDKFYDIYLSHSKLSKEQLQEIAKKEDYSTPQQLLDWGLVDKIVE